MDSTVTVVEKSNIKVPVQDKIGQKNDKKDKTRKKKRKKRISADKDSDHDEITLQLSDSEKMDLLEDFDRKCYDVVSSSSSENTDSSADTESDSNNAKNTSKDSSRDTVLDKYTLTEINPIKIDDVENKLPNNEDSEKNKSLKDPEKNNKVNSENTIIETEKAETMAENVIHPNKTFDDDISKINNENGSSGKTTEIKGFISETVSKNVLVIQNIDDIPIINKEPETDSQDTIEEKSKISKNNVIEIDSVAISQDNLQRKIEGQKNIAVQKPDTQDSEKNLSEGELSEHDSSEVEALYLKPEVVCISDDEKGSAKKKKKKDKKKRDKKTKKKDFQESADENFYKYSDYSHKDNTDKDRTEKDSFKVTDNSIEVTEIKPNNTEIENTESVNLIDYEIVYEILELSDDSSCYEVEGTVLSKEPTVAEIAALSAKIDEIEKEEREDVITEQEIKEFERKQDNLKADDNIENISWKDRYLDSMKVKKVLSTSNILNALRKKNKELKNKLEEKRKQEEELKQKELDNEAKKVQENEAKKEIVEVLVEGSIEHYNTLQGSTKYVDPVKEMDMTEEANEEKNKGQQIEDDDKGDKHSKKKSKKGVTGEMKKDAKQLLKMYKKLIKYNDMKKRK